MSTSIACNMVKKNLDLFMCFWRSNFFIQMSRFWPEHFKTLIRSVVNEIWTPNLPLARLFWAAVQIKSQWLVKLHSLSDYDSYNSDKLNNSAGSSRFMSQWSYLFICNSVYLRSTQISDDVTKNDATDK